ncbi:lysosomal acid phosphatase-like isoform X2 [Tachysurus fulvidraco]|uniref:lysosomal acid phosphatase-like isoform X2 n=1 Tax=Tachysurus fulvidraco TaxID=1234273 RepID=UPI001FED3210|nr:lysosomal acid phosphatase-like isoform X2 [Tachysurus fulvidraco]
MGLCIFSILLFFAFGYSTVECKIRLVTVLYRHGDRSPVNTYPTDPYQESAWPQGFGQLSQIVVRSTDHDRTLMSAASNLAGLYPPNGSQMFHPGLAWQPIPIHTVPQDEDTLLSFPIKSCSCYQVLMNETKRTKNYLNMTKTYKDFLKMVQNKTGLNTTSIEMIWSIYDTLFCEMKHGLRPPAWVTQDVMKTLELLKNFSYQTLFGVHKRKEKSRLQGGVLLGQVIKNLYAATCLNLNQQLKMIMYSAHDTTIVALQEALNVYNGLQPPYASCHIFELHLDQNGSYSVAMFYRNDSTSTEPYSLTLPGCAQLCPLEDFIKLTKSVIPTDWHRECIVRPYQVLNRFAGFKIRSQNKYKCTNTLRYKHNPFQDRAHDLRCLYLKSLCRPNGKINPFWPSKTLPYWC